MSTAENHIIKDTSEGWTRSRCIYSGGRGAYLAAHGTGEEGAQQFFAVAVRFSPDADISPKDYSVSRVLLPIASAIQNAFFRLGSYCAAYDKNYFLPSLADVAWGVRSSAPKLASQGNVNVEIFAVLPHVYQERVGVLRGLYEVKPREDECVAVSGKIMQRGVTPAKVIPAEGTCPTTMFLAKQYEVRASLTHVAHKDDKVVPLHDMFPLGKIHYDEAKEAAETIHYEMVSGRINVDKSYVALCEAVHRGGEEVTGVLHGNMEGGYTIKAELAGTEELCGLFKSMVLTLSRIESRKGSIMPLEVKSRVIPFANGYDLRGRPSPEDCAAYARAVLAFHAESLGYDEQGKS